MTSLVEIPATPSWAAAGDGVLGWLLGAGPAGDHLLGRWLFLRALGVVFLIAFLSLWRQLGGLLGSRGVLPARSYLDRLREAGRASVWRVPTLFWLDSSDRSLHAACAAGVALSLSLIVGWAPALCLLGLWALYLSFTAVGQAFLSYQWDVLLLEAGFLAIFIAPWGLTAGAAPASPYPGIGLLLLWWLLFRLMFQSGAGKLTSGDATWRDLTALEHHFETQPLPTWIGWHAHQFPGRLLRASTLATHVLEIGVPFLLFAPDEIRPVAAAAIAGFQLLIFATGNYNFFNLLTMALCFLAVDDATWLAVLPGGVEAALQWAGAPVDFHTGDGTFSSVRAGLTACIGAVIFTASLPRVWRTLFPAREFPPGTRALVRALEPFRTVNGYGLFRVMTTERPEIVVEGSRDGAEWRAYEFRWKPGDLSRRPRFVAPHQPRLDWQMWFAALGSYARSSWFRAFLGRLLEGAEPVEDLLEHVPFDEPPDYVRARLYRYRFTTRGERRESGNWWSRTLAGPYGPVLSRRRRQGPQPSSPSRSAR